MRRTRRSICCQNCTLRLHNRPFRTHRGDHQLRQQLLHQTQMAKTFFTFSKHFNSTETAQTPTLPAHQVERVSTVRQTTVVAEIIADLKQMPSQDECKNSVAQHQQSTLRTCYLEAPTSPIVAPSRIPSSGEHLLDSSPIN
jgi:aspartate oxidase